MMAAQQRVFGQVRVEGRLELVGEITTGDPPQDRLVLLAETRITSAPLTASLFEQLLADGTHSSIVPPIAAAWDRTAHGPANHPRRSPT